MVLTLSRVCKAISAELPPFDYKALEALAEDNKWDPGEVLYALKDLVKPSFGWINLREADKFYGFVKSDNRIPGESLLPNNNNWFDYREQHRKYQSNPDFLELKNAVRTLLQTEKTNDFELPQWTREDAIAFYAEVINSAKDMLSSEAAYRQRGTGVAVDNAIKAAEKLTQLYGLTETAADTAVTVIFTGADKLE